MKTVKGIVNVIFLLKEKLEINFKISNKERFYAVIIFKILCNRSFKDLFVFILLEIFFFLEYNQVR